MIITAAEHSLILKVITAKTMTKEARGQGDEG